MTRYRILPDRSELAAQARSSVHPIRAETHALAGEIDAELRDGALAETESASARIELATNSLQADNPLINREIQSRLDARRFPTVSARVSEVTGSTNGHYHVRGELTLRHVTHPVSGRATLVAAEPDTLEVTGELTLDVRDFQLDPPKVLGLRVYPEVAVTLRIVAAAEN